MSGEIAPKTREELELEKAVFGDEAGFASEIEKFGAADADVDSGESATEAAGSDDELESDGDLYYIDKGKGDGSDDDENGGSDSDISDAASSDEEPRVWNDSDDEATQVSLAASMRTRKLRTFTEENMIDGKEYERRLRSHFKKLYPPPAWATSDKAAKAEGSDADSEQEDDAEESYQATNTLKDLLGKSTNYVSRDKSKLLPTSDLDIQRLTDVNKQLRSQAVVQFVEFHPTKPLVLAGGFDRALRIYQVDGKMNPLATSLYIENCPFRTGVFHPDGRRVIAAGRRRYMFFWDLATGTVEKVSRLYGHEHTQSSFEKFVISPDGAYIALVGDNGWMNLLDGYTGQWIAGAKIEGDIVDIAWTEPEAMTIINKDGSAWIWDTHSKQMKSRWTDSSLVGVTCLAQSAHWTAVGMESGIVSIYDRRNVKRGLRMSAAEPESWEPTCVIENLVTPISSMRFNPDGQMLVISSKLKRDALRVVHVPTFSVFKNWPTSATPLGHVSCVAWSPHNEMLAAGNEGGSVRLWALNHYS